MLDLDPQEAKLLLDVALMAIGQNRFESAKKILKALEAYRPKSESLSVAEAILLLSKGDPVGALEYIDGELDESRHPSSAMLMAFKGLALLKLERTGDARLILEKASQMGDPAAARMAKDLMPQ